MASLRFVTLLLRDVKAAVPFYRDGLGMRVRMLEDTWAEIETGGTPIALKAADGEATASTGYSPIMTFTISDFDEAVPRLLQLGAHLDGPIKYPAHGKVAALRTPDGHMIAFKHKNAPRIRVARRVIRRPNEGLRFFRADVAKVLVEKKLEERRLLKEKKYQNMPEDRRPQPLVLSEYGCPLALHPHKASWQFLPAGEARAKLDVKIACALLEGEVHNAQRLGLKWVREGALRPSRERSDYDPAEPMSP